MGDSENAQQTSRKRGALKQLSRGIPGLDVEDDSAGLVSGTFKKASDEVLASRRIVRVKRKEPAAASHNPFARVPATAPASTNNAPLPESKLTPAEAVVEDRKAIDTEEEGEVDSMLVDVIDSTGEETEKAETKEKEGDEKKEADKNGDNSDALSSFQQHSSSKNAFTRLTGTAASGPSFSFGSGHALFGLDSSSGSSIIKKTEGTAVPSKQDVSTETETGEEIEKVAFSADSIMFESLDGGWKERCIGVLRVNVFKNGKARLVMRARRNYRVILNASLYPEMKLTRMENKGITFDCVNSIGEGAGKEGLSKFAVQFKEPGIVEELRVAVDKHKDKDSKPTIIEGNWNPFCNKK